MDKVVSIIIPAYNAEKTLSKTIESVLDQSYKNTEIINVDDGSSDKTGEVVKRFLDDKRIKIVTQKNSGVSQARNSGLKIASGKYIMFVDADDYMKPKMVENMLKLAEEHKNTLIVCGKQFGDRKILPEKNGLVCGDLRRHVVYSILKGAILYSPCDKIYSRKIIEENNIRFPDKVSYGEDLIFNLNYLKNINAIYYLKKALYIYNYGDGSSKKSASSTKNRDRMYEALVKFVGKKKYPIELWLIKMRWRMSVLKARMKWK